MPASSAPRNHHGDFLRTDGVDAEALVLLVTRRLSAFDLDIKAVRVLQVRNEDFRLASAVR